MRLHLSALFVGACALAGCATHFENLPLPEGAQNVERRSLDTAQADRPQVLVAISGGGSRAAALGWAVLRELENYSYPTAGSNRRLVDDVSVVSSVSGGSVIAAYFGLYGPPGLAHFEAEFLAPDNMARMEWQAVNPFTWLGLAASGSGRIALEERLFDDRIFHGRTLADLNAPGKPFVILNATDMASGEVFSFTPDRFSDIASEFDRVPVSTAVAASAAFPILLSPVALQNYSPKDCKGTKLPAWIAPHLEKPYGPYLDVEEYKRARYAGDLRRGCDGDRALPVFRQIDYLYLLDGGVADNLGVHALLREIASPQGTTGMLGKINRGELRRLVVLVINARSDAPTSVSTSDSRPGIFGMIGSVTSVPIDATTALVNSQLDVLLAQLHQAASQAPPDARFGGTRIYSIQIDFDQLRGFDPEQRTLREKVKNISTAWTISRTELGDIESAGRLLLRQHPCFQHLLLDLGASDAQFVDGDYARKGCAP